MAKLKFKSLGVMTQRLVGLGFLVVLVFLIGWASIRGDHTIAQRRAQLPQAQAPVPPPLAGEQAPTLTSDDLTIDVPEDAPETEEESQEISSPEHTTASAVQKDKGQKAWQSNAIHFDYQDLRPKIAVILTDVGYQEDLTRQAILSLPGAISFSFPVYADHTQKYTSFARRQGHEVLVGIPLESQDRDVINPGPEALSTGMSVAENRERLQRLLLKASSFVGVVPLYGDAFFASPSHLSGFVQDVNQLGLMLVDTNPNTQKNSLLQAARRDDVAYVNVQRQMDINENSLITMRATLKELEQVARDQGQVAIAMPLYPAVIGILQEWIDGLNGKGIVLAPITALVKE